MRKIYISNWNHGSYTKNENSCRTFLLNRFIQEFKFFNPEIDVTFIGNKSSIDLLTDISNIEIIELSDDAVYSPSQWPIVKVKSIVNHGQGSILHLDYDVFMRYNINHLFDWLETSQCDVLYQSEEFLTRHYYKQTLKQNPEYMELFRGITHKVAYNAGITYFSENACNFIKNLEVPLDLLDANFAGGIFYEQAYIPAKLVQNGFNIHTLNHVIDVLPACEEQYRDLNQCTAQHNMTFYRNDGLFLPKIGTYHFCGPYWKYDDSIDHLKELLYLSQIDDK